MQLESAVREVVESLENTPVCCQTDAGGCSAGRVLAMEQTRGKRSVTTSIGGANGEGNGVRVVSRCLGEVMASKRTTQQRWAGRVFYHRPLPGPCGATCEPVRKRDHHTKQTRTQRLRRDQGGLGKRSATGICLAAGNGKAQPKRAQSGKTWPCFNVGNIVGGGRPPST
jgi:hypothetical protein